MVWIFYILLQFTYWTCVYTDNIPLQFPSFEDSTLDTILHLYGHENAIEFDKLAEKIDVWIPNVFAELSRKQKYKGDETMEKIVDIEISDSISSHDVSSNLFPEFINPYNLKNNNENKKILMQEILYGLIKQVEYGYIPAMVLLSEFILFGGLHTIHINLDNIYIQFLENTTFYNHKRRTSCLQNMFHIDTPTCLRFPLSQFSDGILLLTLASCFGHADLIEFSNSVHHIHTIFYFIKRNNTMHAISSLKEIYGDKTINILNELIEQWKWRGDDVSMASQTLNNYYSFSEENILFKYDGSFEKETFVNQHENIYDDTQHDEIPTILWTNSRYTKSPRRTTQDGLELEYISLEIGNMMTMHPDIDIPGIMRLRHAYQRANILLVLLHLGRIHVNSDSRSRVISPTCIKQTINHKIHPSTNLSNNTLHTIRLQITGGVVSAFVQKCLTLLFGSNDIDTNNKNQKNLFSSKPLSIFASDENAIAIAIELANRHEPLAQLLIALRIAQNLPIPNVYLNNDDKCTAAIDFILPLTDETMAKQEFASNDVVDSVLHPSEIWEDDTFSGEIDGHYMDTNILQSLATTVDNDAQLDLANILLYGDPNIGLAPNVDMAENLFQAAVDGGNIVAHGPLGLIMINRLLPFATIHTLDKNENPNAKQVDEKQNIDQDIFYNESLAQELNIAIEHLEIAASHGDAQAVAGIGYIYLTGAPLAGINRNLSKALEYLLLAADTGHVSAHSNIAAIYMMATPEDVFGSQTDGIPRNVSLARYHLEESIRKGASFLPAMYNLGVLYWNTDTMDEAGNTIRNCTGALQMWSTIAIHGTWLKYSPFSLLRASANFRYAINGRTRWFSDYKMLNSSGINDPLRQSLLQYIMLASLGIPSAQSSAAYILRHPLWYEYEVSLLLNWIHVLTFPLNDTSAYVHIKSEVKNKVEHALTSFLLSQSYFSQQEEILINKEEESIPILKDNEYEIIPNNFAYQLASLSTSNGGIISSKLQGDCYWNHWIGVSECADTLYDIEHPAIMFYNQAATRGSAHALMRLAEIYGNLDKKNNHTLKNITKAWIYTSRISEMDWFGEWPVSLIRLRFISIWFWDLSISTSFIDTLPLRSFFYNILSCALNNPENITTEFLLDPWLLNIDEHRICSIAIRSFIYSILLTFCISSIIIFILIYVTFIYT